MRKIDGATAFAPASIGNIIVGFDILGCSFSILGDEVTVRKIDHGVVISAISGSTADLPKDPRKNTAGSALLDMIEKEKLDFGFSISIKKGIPLGSGLGGSAASAVGAVVAANTLLDKPLPIEKLFSYALSGEAISSGVVHGDNVAPSLYGGITLCTSDRVIPVPLLEFCHCLIIHPQFQLNTRHAREILPSSISLQAHVRQSANLASFLAACYSGNIDLLSGSFEDRIIEQYRKKLIPGFDLLKEMVLREGGMGFSISGAGPSMFTLCNSLSVAQKIEKAAKDLIKSSEEIDYTANTWITKLDQRGAYLK